MPFGFIANASASQAFGSSLSPSKPTGTVKNDIMFAHLLREDANDEPNSTPTDWTRLAYIQNMITNFQYAGLYYKLVGDSEPSSYPWGWSSSTSGRIEIATYRGGFDIADPIDQSASALYTTSDVGVRAGAITVSSDNSPLIFIGGAYRTSQVTFAEQGTFGKDVDDGDTDSDFWDFFLSDVVNAGAHGGFNYYVNMSVSLSTKNGFLVALNPAAPNVGGDGLNFGAGGF